MSRHRLVEAFRLRGAEFVGPPVEPAVLEKLRARLPSTLASVVLPVAMEVPLRRVEVDLPQGFEFLEPSDGADEPGTPDAVPGFTFARPSDWIDFDERSSEGIALNRGYLCVGNDVFGGDNYWLANNGSSDDASLWRLYLPGIELPTWNASGHEATMVSSSFAELLPRLIFARDEL